MSPTAPKRTVAAERRAQALELRKAGYTYQSIGDIIGISAQAAHAHVVKALEVIRNQISEETEALRTLEVQRIDALLYVMWPRAQKGDYQAMDRCIKLMERRAKLLGLDAPTNANINMAANFVINWDEDAGEHDNN